MNTCLCLAATLVVLWTHAGGWSPIKSFETLAQCDAYVEELRRLMPTAAVSRMCLPDSIDPRKGK